MLDGLDLLLVGSAGESFQPNDYYDSGPYGAWSAVSAGGELTAFDTLFSQEEIGKVSVLAFFVRIIGYAAEPIANKLRSKDGSLLLRGEGCLLPG